MELPRHLQEFILALNEEIEASQFCVEEAEPVPCRVRRFAVPTD